MLSLVVEYRLDFSSAVDAHASCFRSSAHAIPINPPLLSLISLSYEVRRTAHGRSGRVGTTHLDTSNFHAMRGTTLSTLFRDDIFRTTSLPISILRVCTSRARWKNAVERRRHALAPENLSASYSLAQSNSANLSRDSLRGGRDGRSRSRESKCQDEAIRHQRRKVILTTRRSAQMRFRGTVLPQSAMVSGCPSTNNPPWQRRHERRLAQLRKTSKRQIKKHAARLNLRGRADSVGRT